MRGTAATQVLNLFHYIREELLQEKSYVVEGLVALL